jgi:hypothetical protein
MDKRSFLGFKPICFDSYESESVGSLRTWTGALTSSAEQKEWRSQAYLFVGRPRTGVGVARICTPFAILCRSSGQVLPFHARFLTNVTCLVGSANVPMF